MLLSLDESLSADRTCNIKFAQQLTRSSLTDKSKKKQQLSSCEAGAYSRVPSVSSKWVSTGLTQAIMTVLLFPPRESLSTLVRTWSR